MFWVITACTLAADRISKALCSEFLEIGSAVTVVPGILSLRLTHNSGIALGMLSGNTAAILLLPVIAIALGFIAFRKYLLTRFTSVATALVIGGFLGNFIDRLIKGYVVDMIYFPFMPFFICNIADIAICLGVAMLMISLVARPSDWVERRKGGKNGSAAKDNADGGQ